MQHEARHDLLVGGASDTVEVLSLVVGNGVGPFDLLHILGKAEVLALRLDVVIVQEVSNLLHVFCVLWVDVSPNESFWQLPSLGVLVLLDINLFNNSLLVDLLKGVHDLFLRPELVLADDRHHHLVFLSFE